MKQFWRGWELRAGKWRQSEGWKLKLFRKQKNS